VAAIWNALLPRQIDPERFVVIQPASRLQAELVDPRAELDDDVRSRVTWKIHDPARRESVAYLASSATGERIYLAREVVEADVLVSAGSIQFDPLMGYRGTNSVFYPGLSSAEAMTRLHGQGHVELGPDESRPLRELVDEVGWLLGNPFSVQVIPSAGGGVSRVLAGACEPVLAEGKRLLSREWRLQLEERPDVVIAAIDDGAGAHGWEVLGAALDVARSLVARGGRIVILSDLDAELPQGLEMIRESASARDAIQPLRKQAPPDLVCATQLAAAADWARVHLLSGLSSETVDELFLIPLADQSEVRRLLNDQSRCVFLEGAQFAHGSVNAA
jgi:nickel-dependent lactate racemase